MKPVSVQEQEMENNGNSPYAEEAQSFVSWADNFPLFDLN